MSKVEPNDDDGGSDSGSEDDTPDTSQPAVVTEGFMEGKSDNKPGQMEIIAGYNNLKLYEAECIKPPPPPAPTKVEDIKQPAFTSVPVITEATARQALLEHIAQQCCWGKGTANKMQFLNLQSSTSFHYILESFMENRSTNWDHEPFKGQLVDGPQNGPAPAAWDIPAVANQVFKNETRFIEVPHTAYVKDCHTCGAKGYLICSRCVGRGKVKCGSCRGRGHKYSYVRTKKGGRRRVRRTCFGCGGRGRRTCYRCSGSGRVTCTTCEGNKRLKWFVKLTVKWVNRIGEHIVERTDLPDELIAEARGDTAFQDTRPRVPPIATFPEAEINQASARLIGLHNNNFPSDLILLQRHTIRAVPVTQCYCQYGGDKKMSYFVYGLETKVHSPEYPDQCCWGCSIL